jgi:hypothetical protein
MSPVKGADCTGMSELDANQTEMRLKSAKRKPVASSAPK